MWSWSKQKSKGKEIAASSSGVENNLPEEYFGCNEHNVGRRPEYDKKQEDSELQYNTFGEGSKLTPSENIVIEEDDFEWECDDDKDEVDDIDYDPVDGDGDTKGSDDLDEGEEMDDSDSGDNTDHVDEEEDARKVWDAKMKEFYENFNLCGEGMLCVGATFKTRGELQKKVVEYLMGKRNMCEVEKTESDRYWVKCKTSECPFVVRAMKSSSVWTVYKIVDHTCQLNPTGGAPQTLHSKQVGEIMADKIVTSGQVMIPRAVQKELLLNYGIKVNYTQACRIQKRAIEVVYGNDDESFRQLPSYLYMLQRANPGTMCDYTVDQSTKKFRYAFFALGASISGFSRARPFIAIDGIHLKSRYRGILFVAVTKDANNQNFPLAFGVAGVECRESWVWFLKHVKYSLRCPVGMLIVSDDSKAISGAVSDVFPDAHHALCCYHIQQNLVTYGKHVIELFKRAAWSYTDQEYEKAMTDLEAHCPTAARHLMTVVGEEKWARVKCPVRRYDIMTTTIVESINNRLNWARRLPICSLLEAARTIVEQWFTYRHRNALGSQGPLTPYATKKLQDAIKAGSRMQVAPYNEREVRVKHQGSIYRVILGSKQCECNVFQHELIPCPHAAAAIRYFNHNPVIYVDAHFKIENLRSMWSGVIMPVPNKNNWVLPTCIRQAVCQSPDNPRQAGRPRMRRHPSGTE